jgi:hypothetical protein
MTGKMDSEMTVMEELADEDYIALADFRHALRHFQAFSEERPRRRVDAPAASSPARHQSGGRTASHGRLCGRTTDPQAPQRNRSGRSIGRSWAGGKACFLEDRRQALLTPTPQARDMLARLSATHRDEIRRLRPLLVSLLGQFDGR